MDRRIQAGSDSQCPIIQPSHQFLVAFAKFIERLHMSSERIRDCLGALAGVKLRSEGMGV
jgi:hypothetical protein